MSSDNFDGYNRTPSLKRYLPKSYFKPDPEIIYLYKNYLINQRINDKIKLGYDEKNIDDIYNLYPSLPVGVKFSKKFKYRKAIKNFILYQYSLKADTFIEKKILKEVKSEVYYIYEKQQYKYMLPFFLIAPFLFRSYLLIWPFILGVFVDYSNSYTADILFFFNFNDILMKYQINPYYKLGRESSDFVNYLNSNKNESFPFQSGKDKKYFDKFFVNNIEEVKFEETDKIVDYLGDSIGVKNPHQDYLKELEKKRKKKDN